MTKKATAVDMQALAALIGTQRVFVGEPVAALVTVVNARQAFGRVDLLVRDCLEREAWVSAERCRDVAPAGVVEAVPVAVADVVPAVAATVPVGGAS